MSNDWEPSPCDVEGCERPARSRGYCNTHYGRWKRNGDPGGAAIDTSRGRIKPAPPECVIEGCTRPVLVKERGWCNRHYSRWQRTGSPTGSIPRPTFREHGLTGYDYHGCRCDVCKQAKAEATRKLRQRLKGSSKTPHGTRNGYLLYGCRCEACSQANREYQQRPDQAARRREVAMKSRQRLLGIPPLEHGASAYTNGRCRCETCTIAARDEGYERVKRDRREQGDAARSVLRLQWTGAELEVILSNGHVDDRELARRLGRTVKAVRNARYKARHDPKWYRVVGITTQGA